MFVIFYSNIKTYFYLQKYNNFEQNNQQPQQKQPRVIPVHHNQQNYNTQFQGSNWPQQQQNYYQQPNMQQQQVSNSEKPNISSNQQPFDNSKTASVEIPVSHHVIDKPLDSSDFSSSNFSPSYFSPSNFLHGKFPSSNFMMHPDFDPSSPVFQVRLKPTKDQGTGVMTPPKKNHTQNRMFNDQSLGYKNPPSCSNDTAIKVDSPDFVNTSKIVQNKVNPEDFVKPIDLPTNQQSGNIPAKMFSHKVIVPLANEINPVELVAKSVEELDTPTVNLSSEISAEKDGVKQKPGVMLSVNEKNRDEPIPLPYKDIDQADVDKPTKTQDSEKVTQVEKNKTTTPLNKINNCKNENNTLNIKEPFKNINTERPEHVVNTETLEAAPIDPPKTTESVACQTDGDCFIVMSNKNYDEEKDDDFIVESPSSIPSELINDFGTASCEEQPVLFDEVPDEPKQYSECLINLSKQPETENKSSQVYFW